MWPRFGLINRGEPWRHNHLSSNAAAFSFVANHEIEPPTPPSATPRFPSPPSRAVILRPQRQPCATANGAAAEEPQNAKTGTGFLHPSVLAGGRRLWSAAARAAAFTFVYPRMKVAPTPS
ncbi:MAG: hypothetical protein LC732_11675, partial [Acidobacteria bacterium]|nr:hypothetical protein [Acidobacteriota bacterium]